MDRFAIFVDAGYFFAAGSQAAFGAQIQRRHLSLKGHADAVSELTSRARMIADDIPLLRIYWYDAMPGPRRSLEQSQLALLAGVKLRLGVLNSNGEQKGVDSLIVTDLVELARNGAISDALLVAGDEDLRIAVELAQSFGVRVHLLAAGEAKKNVSPTLQMEADSVTELDGAWFLSILEHRGSQVTTAVETSPPAEDDRREAASPTTTPPPSFAAAAETVIAELLNIDAVRITDLAEHFTASSSVPPEFDRRLIAKTRALIERDLSGDEKRGARGMFVSAVRKCAAGHEAGTTSAT